MIRWLKRKLRKWLLEGIEQIPQPKAVSQVLQVRVLRDGEISTGSFQVTGAVGLKLIGQSGRETRLIGEGDAIDREQWQALWKRYTPGWEEWRWPDGRPYLPR
jgi:hypothetical protein